MIKRGREEAHISIVSPHVVLTSSLKVIKGALQDAVIFVSVSIHDQSRAGSRMVGLLFLRGGGAVKSVSIVDICGRLTKRRHYVPVVVVHIPLPLSRALGYNALGKPWDDATFRFPLPSVV